MTAVGFALSVQPGDQVEQLSLKGDVVNTLTVLGVDTTSGMVRFEAGSEPAGATLQAFIPPMVHFRVKGAA